MTETVTPSIWIPCEDAPSKFFAEIITPKEGSVISPGVHDLPQVSLLLPYVFEAKEVGQKVAPSALEAVVVVEATKAIVESFIAPGDDARLESVKVRPSIVTPAGIWAEVKLKPVSFKYFVVRFEFKAETTAESDAFIVKVGPMPDQLIVPAPTEESLTPTVGLFAGVVAAKAENGAAKIAAAAASTIPKYPARMNAFMRMKNE